MAAAVLIVIDGLPRWFRSDDLETLCRPFGTVMSAEVVRENRTQRSMQMGFVKMETMEQAQRLRDAVQGVRIDENSVTVTIIQEKTGASP